MSIFLDDRRLFVLTQKVKGTRYALEPPMPGLADTPKPEPGVATGQAAMVSRALARGFARSHVAEVQMV